MRRMIDASVLMRARYVRAILEWHGDTPADLGRLLGVSRDMAYKKLCATRRFTTEDLVAIADHYNVSGDLLLRPNAELLKPTLGYVLSTKYRVVQVRAYAMRTLPHWHHRSRRNQYRSRRICRDLLAAVP